MFNLKTKTTEKLIKTASEARPGDILWWPGHVGIYAGDGQVLHSTPGPGVSITNIWGSPTYLRVG